jgi:hypothetical protein
LQPRTPSRSAEFVERAVEQREVHLADELGVELREMMKRTVPQHDATFGGLGRFEAEQIERLEEP